MDEGIKRHEDWNLLARVDENVKAIKSILDEYPPAVLSNKIENNCCDINKTNEKIEQHINNHTAFWYSVIVPVGVALIGVILVFWKR